MGQRYKNNDIRTSIKQKLYLDGYSDKVPSEINEKIQLTVDVSPQNNPDGTHQIYYNATGTNTLSTTIFTTSSTQDTFITGMAMSMYKDVTGVSAYGNINGFIFNVPSPIVMLSILSKTLTVSSGQQTVQFNPPIKLQRGQPITISMSSATSLVTINASIWGYTVDPLTYDTGAK